MASPIALTAPQLNDLVQDTLKDLGKPNFTEIVTPYQDHIVFRQLLRENRIQLHSGRGIQWNVMVNPVSSSANVGFGASDEVDIEDTMTQASADWRNTTSNYAIIGQELDMNAEPARIVDLVKERRIAAMIGLAELMESNFLG